MLHEQIEKDMRILLGNKNADIEKKNAYKIIVAEFQRQSKPISSDETTLKILQKLKKGEIELLQAKAKRNKTELLELTAISSSKLLKILKTYLPEQVSLDEVIKWVQNNIDFEKLKSPMQAIGVVMKEFKGRIDGNKVKTCIENLLRS